jgi:hypothetical protein
MSTTTSRRNALALVATLPALAGPAAVAAAMDSPDGEILALGKELSDAIAQWLPLDRRDSEMGWAAHSLAWSRQPIGYSGQ